jgi:hypothetical protein
VDIARRRHDPVDALPHLVVEVGARLAATLEQQLELGGGGVEHERRHVSEGYPRQRPLPRLGRRSVPEERELAAQTTIMALRP